MNDMSSTDNRLTARVPLEWARLTLDAHAAEAAWENVRIMLDRVTGGDVTWNELPAHGAPGRIRAPEFVLDALAELTPDQRGSLMEAALKAGPGLWTPSSDPAGLAYLEGVAVLQSPDAQWLIRRALVVTAQGVPSRQSSKRTQVRWLNLAEQAGGPIHQLWWIRGADGAPFLVAATSLRGAWQQARTGARWDVDGERLQRLRPLRASL